MRASRLLDHQREFTGAARCLPACLPQVRDLYWTFRNFQTRVRDFLRYRRITGAVRARYNNSRRSMWLPRLPPPHTLACHPLSTLPTLHCAPLTIWYSCRNCP